MEFVIALETHISIESRMSYDPYVCTTFLVAKRSQNGKNSEMQ